MKYQKASAKTVTPAIPPSTPPTMGPVFEEGGLGVDVVGSGRVTSVEVGDEDWLDIVVEGDVGKEDVEDDTTLAFFTNRPPCTQQHASFSASSAPQQ